MTARKRAINPPMNIYKKIAISFIVLTLILIGVIFYFTLSYAYIDIYPAKSEANTDFTFIITEDQETEKIEDGIFVGEVVNEIYEGEKVFKTTGTKTVFSDIVGEVIVYNDLQTEQSLVATTRLLTADNELYRIKEQIRIPANQSVKVQVYAGEGTDLVNIKDKTKFTVPGLSENLQKYVYAEAAGDFNALGTQIKAISEEEQKQALEIYAQELADQIFTAENADKMKILSKEILSREFSNQVGEEVDEFSLKLEVKVVGVIFDEEIVKKFAVKMLEGQIPLDKELVAITTDSFIYEIDNYDLDNNLAQVKSNIGGVSVISENSPLIDKDKLINLSFDEIEAYLENLEDIEKVEVKFYPQFIKKIPFFQDHIIIRIK